MPETLSSISTSSNKNPNAPVQGTSETVRSDPSPDDANAALDRIENTTGCGGADLANTDAGLFTHRIRLRSEPRDGERHRFHCGNALIVGARLARWGHP